MIIFIMHLVLKVTHHTDSCCMFEQDIFFSFIQFTSYPGFFPHEVTPLPGQLEAPQLLNRVTKAQQFPVSCIIYFMETQGFHTDL